MSDTYLKETSNGVDVSLHGKGASVAGSNVKVLSLREPTVNDHIVADSYTGSAVEKEVALLANLCEVTPEDIRGLTMRNYNRLQAAYQLFTD